LRARLDRTGGGAPLDGIARGGYRLVYTDVDSSFIRDIESDRSVHNLLFSIGLVINDGGKILEVGWNSAAFRAGLVVGGKIIAVNGLAYEKAEDLVAAIKLAKSSPEPIELLVRDDRHFRTVSVPYHDGLRYPHLERVAGKPALLDDLLAPIK
jgi:predicted metalloprotease with PDZ domain